MKPWLTKRKAHESTLLLVDGSNLHASTKALGFFTDFKSLLDNFDGTVFRALYFTALPPQNEQSSLRPMVDWMDYNGWDVYRKIYTEYVNDGVPKIKGNMDIEIAVMAMEMASYVSDIVLFSGDGDFAFLVDSLKRKHGVKVTVVSTIKTRPPMCADILRRQADTFVDLMDIREMIARSPRSEVGD